MVVEFLIDKFLEKISNFYKHKELMHCKCLCQCLFFYPSFMQYTNIIYISLCICGRKTVLSKSYVTVFH